MEFEEGFTAHPGYCLAWHLLHFQEVKGSLQLAHVDTILTVSPPYITAFKETRNPKKKSEEPQVRLESVWKLYNGKIAAASSWGLEDKKKTKTKATLSGDKLGQSLYGTKEVPYTRVYVGISRVDGQPVVTDTPIKTQKDGTSIRRSTTHDVPVQYKRFSNFRALNGGFIPTYDFLHPDNSRMIRLQCAFPKGTQHREDLHWLDGPPDEDHPTTADNLGDQAYNNLRRMRMDLPPRAHAYRAINCENIYISNELANQSFPLELWPISLMEIPVELLDRIRQYLQQVADHPAGGFVINLPMAIQFVFLWFHITGDPKLRIENVHRIAPVPECPWSKFLCIGPEYVRFHERLGLPTWMHPFRFANSRAAAFPCLPFFDDLFMSREELGYLSEVRSRVPDFPIYQRVAVFPCHWPGTIYDVIPNPVWSDRVPDIILASLALPDMSMLGTPRAGSTRRLPLIPQGWAPFFIGPSNPSQLPKGKRVPGYFFEPEPPVDEEKYPTGPEQEDIVHCPLAVSGAVMSLPSA